MELHERKEWGHVGRLQCGSAPDDARNWAELLARHGVVAVLRRLNERTRFRFTGIYRVDPPLLHNLHLHDRENPDLNLSGGARPLAESYCAFVWGDECPFATADSSKDLRLAAHTARESVRSYWGVPIRARSGRVWGTLCHHDVRPRLIPRSETAVLEHVASLLASRLVRAPSRV